MKVLIVSALLLLTVSSLHFQALRPGNGSYPNNNNNNNNYYPNPTPNNNNNNNNYYPNPAPAPKPNPYPYPNPTPNPNPNNNYYPNPSPSPYPNPNNNNQQQPQSCNGQPITRNQSGQVSVSGVTFTFNGPFSYECRDKVNDKLYNRESCRDVCSCAELFKKFATYCSAKIVKTIP